MAPVVSTAIDHAVPQANEAYALAFTLLIAVVTVGMVVRYCTKHRMWWPMIVVGGLVTGL